MPIHGPKGDPHKKRKLVVKEKTKSSKRGRKDKR